MNPYQTGYGEVLKVAGLTKTALNERLLGKLLAERFPGAGLDPELVMYSMRKNEWDLYPSVVRDAVKEWTEQFSMAPSTIPTRSREVGDEWARRVAERQDKLNLRERRNALEDIANEMGNKGATREEIYAEIGDEWDSILSEQERPWAARQEYDFWRNYIAQQDLEQRMLAGHPRALIEKPETLTSLSREGMPKPHPMIDPVHAAYRGAEPTKQVYPHEPTWLSGHPEIALSHADAPNLDQPTALENLPSGRVYQYDPDMLSRGTHGKGPWTQARGVDTRTWRADLPHASTSGAMAAESPIREMVAEQLKLREALYSRWKPLPGGKMMELERFG